ncbi:hypothetical protein [Limosilactobacillus agrestimuris]|uniref:hypothetical protein n=1 Tax=Limosilactobacillus agrestimuris TaxID=2941331 RepID=UPI00203D5AB6|nr:hypothetical protein [Limosilactobacillus agrestimuris]
MTNNKKELEKAEKKHLAPDDSTLHLDEVVVEDGNYYSKDAYDAMVKADMEED